MNEIRQINISKLLLDLENPRFTKDIQTQRDAINLMLEIQQDKIIRLAKDIATEGMDPSENLMVYSSHDDPDFFVVAEGNRRTTALKLIAEPSLAENGRIRKIFSKIQETVTTNLSSVSCVIFDDDSYEHWVNLKHTGDNKGVGRERWTTPEADRYRAKHGKTSYQSQLYGFMLRQEEAYAEILKRKKFVYATNLSRLFGDKKTMFRFGLSAQDGYLYCAMPYSRFVEYFKKVLDVMTDINPERNKPDFNVNMIYLSDDRQSFLDQIGIEAKPELLPSSWKLDDPNAGKRTSQSTQSNGTINDNFGSRSSEKGDKQFSSDNASSDTNPPEYKQKPIPKTTRNILIPSTVKLNFGGNKKCSQIFNELKTKMTHDKTGFSIAVMLRVFLDLSLTAFIEKKELKFKDHPRYPGLYDKVVMCCDYLRAEKLLTQAHCSSICAYSKDKLNSSGTIQQYVHNQHHIPSRDIVNTEWDNFQLLFEAMWSAKMQAD